MAADPFKSETLYPLGGITGSGRTLKYSPGSRWRVRTGWLLTVLSGLFLIFDGVGKLMMPAPVMEATVRLGFPASMIQGVGFLLLACTLVYLIPRTAILGAILLSGFLGGAVAIQLRAGSPMFETVFPVLFAILVWGGVYLRETRLCALVPIRRS